MLKSFISKLLITLQKIEFTYICVFIYNLSRDEHHILEATSLCQDLCSEAEKERLGWPYPPINMTTVLISREEETQAQGGEGHVMAEAEVAGMQLQAKGLQGLPAPPETRKR